MQTLTLEISKKKIYQEVERTTSYIGAKIVDDVEAYQRIRTIDEDAVLLDRFWKETKAEFCNLLKEYLFSVEQTGEGAEEQIEFKLRLSESWDSVLGDTMQQDLFSFFVLNIIAKWFTLSNKAEAEGYKEAACGILTEMHINAIHKNKPMRPTYR